jgi:hypothetical protein
VANSPHGHSEVVGTDFPALHRATF